MSAWLLGSSLMTEIRNKLAVHATQNEHKPVDLAVLEATRLVMKWNKMNRYAIGCRYGERTKPVRLGKFTERVVSDVQFAKHLQCLSYQCSEGDTDRKYARSWKLLEKWIGEAARATLHTHPEYNAAKWGDAALK
jgi:hypothetical protein